MNEVITRIHGRPYGINFNYELPEMSCFDCFHYSTREGSCGTMLIRDERGRMERVTRYSACLKDGPKALWRPRLEGR